MKTHCFLSFLFFVKFLSLSIAQSVETMPEDLKFKHFTPSNGLSQISVIAILQDKKGYLWFGTRDGLNKFDGHEFTVYKHKIGDTTSLSHNSIHSIYQDSYGNLWVGTQNGLNRYNPNQDNFIQYTFEDQQQAAKGNIVWEVIQIDKERLWVATDNGIFQINIKTHQINRKLIGDRHQSTDKQIRCFLKTNDGNIWIARTKYIEIYNPVKKSSKRIEYPKRNKNNIHLNNIVTLFADQKNSIWLGYEQGLAQYDPQSETFVDFELQGKEPITTSVRSICEDLYGNLWIGAYSGLYLLDPKFSNIKHIVHDENNATSLSQNSIHKIIRDSRGDMWLGTWANGINYYSKDNAAFKTIPFGNTSNKLNYRVVSGIAEDKRGNLWIGTEGGGLNFYDIKTKEIAYYKHDPQNPNSLSADNVKSVLIDQNDNIWIGLYDGGLNFLNPRQRPFKFQKIDFPDTYAVPLKGYKIQTLLEDRNGNIWIGTSTGGVIFYDVEKKLFSKIDEDVKMILSITQTKDPNLLLVGGDSGLDIIDIRTKETEKLHITGNEENEFPLYITCIFVDQANNYWIGTEGKGVYIYNPEKRTVKTFRTKDGLPNDIVYGILSDNSGDIWISTNNGISRLEGSTHAIKNFNQADGLQGNEFNYGSFFKSKSGELFFGGINGLTFFNPEHIYINDFRPTIDIMKVQVNNELYAHISDAVSEIKLKHNENNFSIDFTSLSYLRSEKNEFAYILEGNDKNWIDIGNQRKAVYTNIKEGSYTFRVKGSNNDGIWNEHGASFHIRVLPAPWKTWWAYTLYLLVFGGLFFYIRKLILLRTKERKEKEKIEEINQLKLNLFTDVSHDFRTPLTLIIGPLEKMIRSKSGDHFVQEQHGIMYRNARMLLQLINEILDFRKTETNKLSLQCSETNIVPFIEDIKKSFDALAEKKNISYTLIKSHETISVWFDKIKLKKIIYNLLSNAFKFTENDKEITVHVSTTTKIIGSKSVAFVKITVVNFGAFIPNDQIDFIFDRFYQLDHEYRYIGSGIGLALTKKLVELHKGLITVQSAMDKGTHFNVFLRLGSTHLSADERIHENEAIMGEKAFYIDPVEIDPQVSATENLSSDTDYQEELQSLLIVEDNLELQSFIRQIFIYKYNVFVAENGKQAIAIAHQHTIDLIISDVSMPEMDGVELCHQIKTTLATSHIPMILLTAKTSTTHQEKGYRTGADAYITKPFNAEILEIRVDNLLKTRANLIRKFKQDAILEPKKLATTSPDETFLEKAALVVEQNMADPDFNVGTFVQEMNMSRTVIYTKIKALTGQNLSTFIRIIRLKKAATLIAQTDMNIAQVAYEVGFNDLKYFRESFKEIFKMTPSEYKRQHHRADQA